MGLWEDLTGKSVEAKVTEYGEIYGEVLVGLHRVSQEQESLVRCCEERLDAHSDRLAEQAQDLAALDNGLRDVRNRYVAIHDVVKEQERLVGRCKERLDAHRDRLDEQAQDLVGIDSSFRDLQNRYEAFEGSATERLDAVRSAVDRYHFEATALATTRERQEQLAQDLKQATSAMSDAIAAQAKQIRLLQVMCVVTCFSIVVLGVALWMTG